MITKIFAKTSGGFMLMEDDAGQCYQAPAQLLAAVDAARREALEPVPENWELVDESSTGASPSHDAHPDQVIMLSAIEPAGERFVAHAAAGTQLPLTATELKTLLNATGIHNAKARGVQP